MRMMLLVALALAGLVASTGCLVPHRRHGHWGVAVVIPHAHVHDHHCGHYRYGGNWFHIKGHVHAAGCGHSHVNNVWIAQDE